MSKAKQMAKSTVRVPRLQKSKPIQKPIAKGVVPKEEGHVARVSAAKIASIEKTINERAKQEEKKTEKVSAFDVSFGEK